MHGQLQSIMLCKSEVRTRLIAAYADMERRGGGNKPLKASQHTPQDCLSPQHFHKRYDQVHSTVHEMNLNSAQLILVSVNNLNFKK